jgi:hypothetical protein
MLKNPRSTRLAQCASGGTAPKPDAIDDRILRRAAMFFAVAVVVHNADHLRRGGAAVSAEVFWLGSAAVLIEVALVALVFMRHPLAALAAAVGGADLAVGYMFVHFTPPRSWLSDSFLENDASPMSVSAASLETLAAVMLSLAGVLIIQERRTLAGSRRSLRFTTLLRHPVVCITAVSNALIFVLTLAERSLWHQP